MRKFVIALVLLIGVMFLIGHFAELQSIAETLQRGDLRYLLLAVFVELVWLLNLALTYRSIFRALGVDESVRVLLTMATAANFVNVVAPTAGMGGVAVFASEAGRRGHSSGRATVASVLFVLYDYLGFLAVLGVGLLVLVRRDSLNLPEVVASGILVGIAGSIAALLYMGMQSQTRLGTALAWFARRINRLLRRPYLSEGRAHAFAHDTAEGLRELSRDPGNLLFPGALALNNKALLISVLFLTFLAFGTPFSPGTLIAGFSLAYLFTIVSPTPAGVGIVEGVMTLTLHSLYVPLSAAAVITLAYRAITFWLPLLLGLIAFRTLAHQAEAPAPKGS